MWGPRFETTMRWSRAGVPDVSVSKVGIMVVAVLVLAVVVMEIVR